MKKKPTRMLDQFNKSRLRYVQACNKCVTRSYDVMSSFLMTPSVSWCRFRWSERWSDLAKRRSQSSHLKGFSPVCLRMCRVSSSERAKLQLHSFQLHVYGFSPAKNNNRTRCSVIIFDDEPNHTQSHSIK